MIRTISRLFCFPFFIFVTTMGSLSFAQSLCYSTQSRSMQRGPVDPVTMDRNTRHALALEASALIYQLPDLETAKTGAAFLTAFEKFEQALPSGYHFEHFFANRSSGLKYMMLRPDRLTDPWIFAFAGTQTTIDWLSDITFGKSQFANVLGMIYLFTNCEYADSQGTPFSAHNWIITGHSLGGGLAQTMAYNILKRRVLFRLNSAGLELVTFNAFGALEFIDGDPAETLKSPPAFNYFLTSDPISRLGRHLGATYEFVLPETSSPSTILQRHLMETVVAAAMPNGVPQFDRARPAVPPQIGFLESIRKYAHYLKFLPDIPAANTNARFNQVKVLEEAQDIILAHRQSGPYDSQALRYIGNMAMVFSGDLDREPSGYPLHDRLTERLSRILNR